MTQRIEDEPVRFFLRHRAQIEEWAALGVEAKRLAHQVMIALGDRLAERPPPGCEVTAGEEGGYRAWLLYRPGWLGEDGRPVVAVGIVWSEKSVDFRSGNSWIGVWRGLREKSDPLPDLLRSSLAPAGKKLGLKSKGWPEWPLYRRAPAPTGDFWDDLRPWMDELEHSIHSLWELIADDIDRIVRQLRA